MVQSNYFLSEFKYPRWIVLQLLEKCNLRCKMCYEWGKEGAYHEKGQLSQLDPNVVKKVIEDCSPVKPYYDFFGGEPLLYPWVDEIITCIRANGSGVDIPTNGTILEKNAEMLVETEPTRLWMSLDGPEEINDEQRGRGVYRKVLDGIGKLYETRQSKGKKYPKIGVSFIITPLNYMYIEDMFFKHIDLSVLDHISIEVQHYTTEQQCVEYEHVLNTEFGIGKAPHARGLIWDTGEFAAIDVPEVIRQLNKVSDYCKKNHIFLITYPKTIDEDNLRNHYTGRFDEMIDKKSRCGLPWIYAEINARGEVAPCHSFYDLTFGNVNEESILDIWNSPKYKAYKGYMKKNMLPICTACSRYYVNHSKAL